MEHNWILYKNEVDAGDEKSYYCLNCNMKIWTGNVHTLNGVRLYTYSEDVNFEYGDFTCEEYIIKQIIE